jgi:hypothetical protein
MTPTGRPLTDCSTISTASPMPFPPDPLRAHPCGFLLAQGWDTSNPSIRFLHRIPLRRRTMEAVKRVGFSGLDLKGTPPPYSYFQILQVIM